MNIQDLLNSETNIILYDSLALSLLLFLLQIPFQSSGERIKKAGEFKQMLWIDSTILYIERY